MNLVWPLLQDGEVVLEMGGLRQIKLVPEVAGLFSSNRSCSAIGKSPAPLGPWTLNLVSPYD